MEDQDRAAQRRREADVAAKKVSRSIDDYLQTIEAPRRAALERIRALSHQIVPGAQEAIMYGMPTLTYRGKPFLGFANHKHHIGIYPYSGEVVETLRDQLQAFGLSKGSIRVPVAQPIPESTLRQVIDCRLEQIRATAKGD